MPVVGKRSSEVKVLGGRLFPLWFKGMAGLLILLLGVVAATDRVLAAEPFPEVQARAHVVMEFDSGLVLDAHRADEPLPPASLTEMMTGYLVLEKIRSGEIDWADPVDRKSTRLNSSHVKISYAVFCLKKKKRKIN